MLHTLADLMLIVCWLLDFVDWWLERNFYFVVFYSYFFPSGGMSSEGNIKVVGTTVLLSKRSRATYKSHLTKLEKDITKFFKWLSIYFIPRKQNRLKTMFLNKMNLLKNFAMKFRINSNSLRAINLKMR